MLTKYPYITSKVILKKTHNADYRVISNFDGNADDDIIVNESIKYLISLCDGQRSVLDIINEISAVYYESSYADIKEGVENTFAYLNDSGLVVMSGFNIPSEKLIIKEDSSLETVYIELTNECNLKCIHCYNESGSVRQNELSTEGMLSLIDRLGNAGVTDVVLTGGEPFKRKDIFMLINEIANHDMRFSIFSNGLLVTPEIATQLKKYDVQFVAVSLDGANAATHEMIRGKNTFKRTIEKIKLLKNYGINIRINHTLTTRSILELEQFMHLMKELNIDNVFFDRFDDFGRGRENKQMVISISDGLHVRELIDKYSGSAYISSHENASTKHNIITEKNLCGVGVNQCYIKSNGDLTFCPVMSTEDYVIGNIMQHDIATLWASTKWDVIRNASVEQIPLCTGCESKPHCLGGCKAKAHHYNGEFLSPDPWACSQFNHKKHQLETLS